MPIFTVYFSHEIRKVNLHVFSPPQSLTCRRTHFSQNCAGIICQELHVYMRYKKKTGREGLVSQARPSCAFREGVARETREG